MAYLMANSQDIINHLEFSEKSNGRSGDYWKFVTKENFHDDCEWLRKLSDSLNWRSTGFVSCMDGKTYRVKTGFDWSTVNNWAQKEIENEYPHNYAFTSTTETGDVSGYSLYIPKSVSWYRTIDFSDPKPTLYGVEHKDNAFLFETRNRARHIADLIQQMFSITTEIVEVRS